MHSRRHFRRKRVNADNYRDNVLALLHFEVEQYHELRQAVLDHVEEIAWESGMDLSGAGIRSSTPSDPTARKAMQVLSTLTIMEAQRKIRAIYLAMDEFCAVDEKQRRNFIHLWFWCKEIPIEHICRTVNLEKSQLYVWRDKFLEVVARNLGWRLTP